MKNIVSYKEFKKNPNFKKTNPGPKKNNLTLKYYGKKIKW